MNTALSIKSAYTGHLEDDEFNQFSQIIYNEVGIKLGSGKKIMVESRLTRRLRDLSIESFQEYLKYLKNSDEEMEFFINGLTTNKTEFFRERDHFLYLKSVVFPQIFEEKKDNVFIWSAASSTGQEIYSLAMCLHEFFFHNGVNAKVLGTDVDTEVLKVAQKGIYKKSELEGVTPAQIALFFEKGRHGQEGLVRVNSILREMTKFRSYNLIKDTLKSNIKFDAIFLRNVLIYFDAPTIQKVVNKLHESLRSGGYLFIGHSETLNAVKHPYEVIKSSIYRKR